MGGLRRRVLKFGGTSVGTRGGPALRRSRSRRRRPASGRSWSWSPRSSGVTNALEAALAGAAASRLDVAGLRRRHPRPAPRPAGRGGAGQAGPAGRRRRPCAARGRAREPAAGGVRRRRRFSAAARAGVLALGERLSVPIVEAALRARGLEAHARGRRLARPHRRRVRGGDGGLPRDAPARARPPRRARARGRARGHRLPRGHRGGRDDAPRPRRVGPHGRGPRLGARRRARRDLVGRGRRDDRRPAPRPHAPRRCPGSPTPRRPRSPARGAKVLHPRTLEPLEGAGIPVFVGNTLRPDAPGDLDRPRGRDGRGGRHRA